MACYSIAWLCCNGELSEECVNGVCMNEKSREKIIKKFRPRSYGQLREYYENSGLSPVELADETRIRDDEEVKLLTAVTVEGLAATFERFPAKFDSTTQEHLVRFHAVAASCRQARERTGKTVKEVGALLKIQQYRIKRIESGYFDMVKIEILEKYISFLGLDEWFEKWKKANRKCFATMMKSKFA